MRRPGRAARIIKNAAIVILVLAIIITPIVIMVNSEGSKRTFKSIMSNYGGGLERTVSVYSYDGDLIKTYTGKFDVDGEAGEVFFDRNGKRVVIHGGIVINEEN